MGWTRQIAGALASIVAKEFEGEPIDLVIDDASHLLEPTRASFEVLFPRLRTDGLFVIEDWAWEHAIANKLFVALGSESRPPRGEARAVASLRSDGDEP